MPRKKKAEPATLPAKAGKATGSNVVEIALEPGKSQDRLLAETALNPTVLSAASCVGLTKNLFGDSDLMETANALKDQVTKAKGGDLSDADRMLVTQAYTLDSLFHNLLRRGLSNAGDGRYLDAATRYLTLAMKAQAQARCTWETLSKIHNPPSPTFIRQANVANGPQQVNNGTRTDAAPIPPNELQGEAHAVDA
jgi:hypothetical protein